jgi:hypothetical protein
MDKEGCVFVIGADKDIINKAIKKNYQSEADKFLEKIVQLSFTLPKLEFEMCKNFLVNTIQNETIKIMMEKNTELTKLLYICLNYNVRSIKYCLNNYLLYNNMAINLKKDLKSNILFYWIISIVGYPAFARLVRNNTIYVEKVLNIIEEKEGIENTKDKNEKEKKEKEFQKKMKDDPSLDGLKNFFDNKDFRSLVELLPKDPEEMNKYVNFTTEMEINKENLDKAWGKFDLVTFKAILKPYINKSEFQDNELVKKLLGEKIIINVKHNDDIVRFADAIKEENELKENINKIDLDDNQCQLILSAWRKYNENGYIIFDKDGKKLFKPVEDIKFGIYPVTNGQYKLFIEDKGYENQDYWDDYFWETKGNRMQPDYWADPKFNLEDHPVIGVSFYEAEAYCNWLSAKTRKTYRLSSEEEWVIAAGWVSNKEKIRNYPWGDGFDKKKCNTNIDYTGFGRTTPVDKYPNGISPLGCYDMGGNVWEWTTRDDANGKKVTKGGSWGSRTEKLVKCLFSGKGNPANGSDVNGFRYVMVMDE